MKIKPSRLHEKMTVENSSQQSTSLNKAKKPGLTLVEVIISVALLAILSVPVSGFVNSSIQMNKKAEVKQQATLLAQQVFEELGSKKSLMIGENSGLFGFQSVEVKSALECSKEFCINNLPFDNMNVDLNFESIIDENSIDAMQYSNELSNGNDSKATGMPANTQVFFELTNKNVVGSIIGYDKSESIEIGNKNEERTLKITITRDNTVEMRLENTEEKLPGKLDNGNFYFYVKNNNKNGPIHNIEIANNSSLLINMCVNNKAATGHDPVNAYFSTNSGGGTVEHRTDEDCTFSNGQPPVTPPEEDLPTADNQKLYNVTLEIFSKKNREVLFTGNRVVRLEFIEDEG